MPRSYGSLKRKLEEERARLKEEIERLGVSEEERPGYGNHMADDATGVFEQTRNLSLRESLEDTLSGSTKRSNDSTRARTVGARIVDARSSGGV